MDIDVGLGAASFAYGDQWGVLKMKNLGSELKLYKKHGCKYIFLPQALGLFNHVRAVIGDAHNVVQFPDFSNTDKKTVPDYWKNGQQKVFFIPKTKMKAGRKVILVL